MFELNLLKSKSQATPRSDISDEIKLDVLRTLLAGLTIPSSIFLSCQIHPENLAAAMGPNLDLVVSTQGNFYFVKRKTS